LRPFGPRKRLWDAKPGFHFASSGAIFDFSLRENSHRISVSEANGTISGKKIIHAISLGFRGIWSGGGAHPISICS
jgi:hypothetical protein